MSRISPFRGLLYDPSRGGAPEQVTSPPYDVISNGEQIRYREMSPYNVVHLEFNEKDADTRTRANEYTRAAADLGSWRTSGVLRRDREPAYYAYEMSFTHEGAPRRIRGLICEVEIEPWGGSIIPHERTMRKQVDDRLGLLRELRANISPVYAAFGGPAPELTSLLDHPGEPLVSLMDEAGVGHRMWRLQDARIAGWIAGEDLLIADGHHRYTVGLAFREEMRRREGPGPWDRIMMLIVDAASEDPPVLPIHRILATGAPEIEAQPASSLEEVLGRVNDDDLVCGMADGSAGYASFRLAGDPPTVVALHDQVLDALDTDGQLTFTADPFEADRAVRAGEASASFFLPPTTAERIRAVIDRGQRLPQKSTYFWPKPRTGMVIRSMD